MPTRFAFLLAAALASGNLLAQTSAPITAVTLYPGSATVTRTARIDAGSGRLVLDHLPANFSMQTFRVEPDAGIRVGQIVTQDVARVDAVSPAEASLQSKIQALKDEVALLDVQDGAADIVRAYLERVNADAGDRNRAGSNSSSLATTIGTLDRAALDALGRKQKVAAQKRELLKRLDALERDLRKQRGDTRDSRTVTIQLAAERAGTVRISYQVNSAGWKPAYRADLDSKTGTLAMERLAEVSQKTGEDWRGVKLSLSTIQPRAMPNASLPQPWLLSWFAPQLVEEMSLRRSIAPPPSPAPAAVTQAASGRFEKDSEPAYIAPTFQVDSSFATEFVVPAVVNLASDGREISLALSQVALKAKQLVQVTPRLSTTPVLLAEADRPTGVWPAGTLQTYRDGGYLGAVQWQPAAAPKWRIAFGSDDLVQVRIDAIKGDSASTGVFERRNVRQISDEITVRNNHGTPVDVIVIEATPISTSDAIKVQAKFEPKPTVDSVDQRRGVIAWERTIAPQQVMRIGVNYTIESPKEGSVAGLR